jgi:transcriptional regulator with XRE-family HTH domain
MMDDTPGWVESQQDLPKTCFDNQRFSLAVKQMRGELSYREAARITGISASSLCRVEMGKKPEPEVFAHLCAWMRIDPREFFYQE